MQAPVCENIQGRKSRVGEAVLEDFTWWLAKLTL